MGKLWKTAKWLLGASAMFGAFVLAELLRDGQVSPREYLSAAMMAGFFGTATFCLSFLLLLLSDARCVFLFRRTVYMGTLCFRALGHCIGHGGHRLHSSFGTRRIGTQAAGRIGLKGSLKAGSRVSAKLKPPFKHSKRKRYGQTVENRQPQAIWQEKCWKGV